MNNQGLVECLTEIVGAEGVRMMEPMAAHTTFRIGGPADYFVMPKSEEELVAVLTLCREESVPCQVIGNGSNLLVGDLGVRGVVVQLGKAFSKVTVEKTPDGGKIFAQAGAMLAGVAKLAGREGLTGLEFASGIPGSVGGGVVMNAGAYGGELSQVVTEVTMVSQDGRVHTAAGSDMAFGYRTSLAQESGELIVSAVMTLNEGDTDAIAKTMEQLREQRVSKQPLDLPSAGSTFKRPEGYFAGKLIMDAGLRGYRVGHAQVSEKHCGFVVNTGGATAKDVTTLMADVTRIVREKFGVTLEPEVKRIGEFA